MEVMDPVDLSGNDFEADLGRENAVQVQVLPDDTTMMTDKKT